MEIRGHKSLLLFVWLLAAGMILACDLGGLFGGGEAPSVVIERPPSDVQVNLGDTVPIHATATDSTGVTRAELWVDDTLLATEMSPVAQGQPSFSVVFRWRPEVQGAYRIVVKAYNASGSVGESSPITVFVVEGGARPEPTPTGPQATQPGPEPTPSAPQQTPPGPQPTQPGPPPATSTAPPPPPTNTPLPPAPTNTPPSGPCLPTTVTIVNVGGHPKGVAVAGHKVYVGIHDAPVVVVIDADNNSVLDTLDTGVPGAQQANGVVVHPGTGWVYVANKTDGSVSAIDPSGAASPVIVTTNALPFGLAAAGQYVYVANFGADRVGRINVSTYAFQSLMSTFNEPCLLGGLGQDVFVPTNGAGPIYRIPPSGNPIAIGQDKTGYFAVAANPTSNRVFVTDRDGGDVIKIDANSNSVEGKVHIPNHRPYGIAVNPTKGRVYVVAAEANLLYVIKGPTLQIIGSVAVGGQGAVEGGQGIALSGDRIYVSNYQDGTVTVLDDAACP
ncbi:MAG TPA: Ig-like domain-containing protein [Anaerolineae bacterium]|nr:Ig-like domain-containing protein [Anaerolineae bacterium]